MENRTKGSVQHYSKSTNHYSQKQHKTLTQNALLLQYKQSTPTSMHKATCKTNAVTS